MSDTNRNHDERIRHLEAELALLKRNAKPYERTVSGPWKDYTQGVYAHTFFDDLQYQLIGQNMTSPAARIAYSVNRDYVKFPKTCDWNDDWLTMVIQMSHRWKVGTAIYPHIHWIQTGEKTPNFLVGWLWQVNGATTATTWDYLIHQQEQGCQTLCISSYSGTWRMRARSSLALRMTQRRRTMPMPTALIFTLK